MKFIGASFPTSSLNRGDTFLHTPSGAVYEFVEGNPINALSWRIVGGQMTSDPDTTGWGNNQRGAQWYNSTDQQGKMWNGTEIVLVG